MLLGLLLILPALTLASNIEIEIKGEYQDEGSNLVALLYGEDTTIATDKERKVFKLQDDFLKDGIRIIHGAAPDNVYVCSPTPWGDLYKTYNWKQVKRILSPSHATLTRISSKPETITQQIFDNNSTKPVSINVALSKDVKNSIHTHWHKLGDLTVGDVKYKFSLDVKGIHKEFNRDFSWGENGKKFIGETLGTKSEINLTLQPHQAVIAKLEAKKATISIYIEYETVLEGNVAANYETPYNGHHFYKFEVNDILSVKNLPIKSRPCQLLTLNFYYDAKIVVHDQKVGTQLIEKKFPKSSTPTRTKLKTSNKTGNSESKEESIPEENIPEEQKKRIPLTIPKNFTSIANDDVSIANDSSVANISEAD